MKISQAAQVTFRPAIPLLASIGVVCLLLPLIAILACDRGEAEHRFKNVGFIDTVSILPYGQPFSLGLFSNTGSDSFVDVRVDSSAFFTADSSFLVCYGHLQIDDDLVSGRDASEVSVVCRSNDTVVVSFYGEYLGLQRLGSSQLAKRENQPIPPPVVFLDSAAVTAYSPGKISILHRNSGSSCF